jgi:hypothetical protein
MSRIICPYRALESTAQWDEELLRLHSGEPLFLKPIGTPVPSTSFCGASVRVAHDCCHLYILAQMEDTDIYNRADAMNQKTWMLGDVFEIFLRPESQEAYYEFHLTPENQVLQLRMASEKDFYRQRRVDKKYSFFEQCQISEVILKSRTRIMQDLNQWWVMVSLPLDRISEKKAWEPTDVWRVSFSRYDYTRGVQEPLLSSTSQHLKVDFHDQSCWQRLVFNSARDLS